MRKKTILVHMLSLSLLAVCAMAQSPAGNPAGLWLTEGGKSIVEITSLPENSTWKARIVWLKEPSDKNGLPLHDALNPDPGKQKSPIMGLTIAWGFKSAKDRAWEDGQVYDPETGKTYKAQAKMKGEELELRGYIGIPALGRSTSWKQVSHLPTDSSAKK